MALQAQQCLPLQLPVLVVKLGGKGLKFSIAIHI
jgi:hypothetical protein